MSDLLVRLGRLTKKPKEKPIPEQEQAALDKLHQEAEEVGTDLASDGKGGLPPSLVLGVMRRDKYRCKRCGSQKGISVHHKGGIVESKWLSSKGHHNDANNLVTICEACHDAIHEEAREEGVDSSQVTPKGDR